MNLRRPLSRSPRGPSPGKTATDGVAPASAAPTKAATTGAASGTVATRRVPRRGRRAKLTLAPALVLGASLCAFAVSAVFIPGFVFGAEAAETGEAALEAAAPTPGETEEPATESVTAAAVPETGEAPITVTASFAGETPSSGTLLVTLPWGDGEGAVGLVRPLDGLTRGPEALAVSPDGRIAILDSVNRRVIFLGADGSWLGTAAIPLAEPRFLAVTGDRLYVLDCDADRQLLTLGWDGLIYESLALPDLPDVVTGLFATVEGPCVEVAHDEVFVMNATEEAAAPSDSAIAEAAAPGAVSIGEAAALAGAVDEITAAGDPSVATASRDSQIGGRRGPARASLRAVGGRPVDRGLGRVVKATFAPDTGLQVRSSDLDRGTLRAKRTIESTPLLAPGRAVDHLVSIDGDGNGGIIVGARLLDAGSSNHVAAAGAPAGRDDRRDSLGQGLRDDTRQSRTGPACLLLTKVASADSGRGTGAALLLTESSFAYLGLPYVVTPDGTVYQPVADETGYSILVHRFAGTGSPVATEAGSAAAAAEQSALGEEVLP
jgi:hypothetical protein